MNRVRRALLFMPGDDRRKISKGISIAVDSIIMDIEDGVAMNRKAEARSSIAAALRQLDFGRSEKLVRINAVSTGLYEADIHATVDARPDGYVLPKTESADDVLKVSEILSQAEQRYRREANAIRLIAIVETGLGVINLREIANSHPRLVGLAFGAEDFASSIGAIRTGESWEVFHARSEVVLYAKTFGLQALDTPFVDFENNAGLVKETGQALQMGYTGKLAIHPRQVEAIQTAFTPTTDQIMAAKRLIEAHEKHQSAGEGVFEIDGRMIDMPMIRAAESVLARARTAGIEIDD